MEIRIVVFLAFVSANIIVNTVLIFFAYKMFAGLTNSATQTMANFSKNSETRELIDSLQVAAERAATISETTKIKIAEFDPKLRRAHESFRETLVTVDSKLEEFADRVSTAAETMRDTVAKPAFTVVSFAAGMSQALQNHQDDD